MTITVIGHLCLDVIHYPPSEKRQETQSYGGIFFTVAGLANLVEPHTTIVPVAGVGKKEYPNVIEQLSVYPNVDTSGIYTFNGPTNEVHLYYQDDQQRTECSKHIAEPIPFKQIKPHLDVDMILMNMISGFDVTLETLDEMRMMMREKHLPIYFDAHSLSLGIREDYTRFRRPLADWRRWLFSLHAVQMNEEEAPGLTAESFTDEYFAKHVTALNTGVLIITRGANGCTVYVNEQKHLSRHDFAGISIKRHVDATGCGDVFGAAYCAKYLETKNILHSVEFANTVAAYKATIAGSTEIDRLVKFKLEGETTHRAAAHSGAIS